MVRIIAAEVKPTFDTKIGSNEGADWYSWACDFPD
jgi:hypothetical protein